MKKPRRTYSKEFKETVVRRLGTAPVTEVAKANGLSPSVVHRWWRQIGDHRVKPSLGRRMYTTQLKKAALQQLEAGVSLREAAAACEVSPELLRRWLTEFREFGERAFSGYGKSRALINPVSINISLRFTEDEYQRLKAVWSSAGHATASDFVRDQVFNAAIARQPSVAEVEDALSKLAAAIRQLGATIATRKDSWKSRGSLGNTLAKKKP
jgi:transposase-like protein